MEEGAIVQTAIDLLDCFLEEGRPVDSLSARFFRERRFIGAHDRRDIAKLVYDILRNFETLSFVNSDITADFSRFLVISFFVVVLKYDEKKISEIFSGKKYCVEKLSDFDKRFIKKISNINIEQLPENIKLNYPAWTEDRLKKRFSVDFEKEMKAFNHKASVDVRVNTLKANSKSVFEQMKQDKIPVERTKFASNCIRILHGNIPHSYELIKNGTIEFQDEGSQMICEFCEAEKANVVVDFCAGAGGKTLALAAIMKNKGRIYATDKDENRLQRAKERLKRAGVCNVYCNAVSSKWIKRHLGFADCVLVDAPCSGSGTWRRNPDARIRLKESDISELIVVQKEILESASKLVKVGGLLVYSTCSVFEDENENQIRDFLKNHKNYRIKKISFPVGNDSEFFVSSPYKHGMDGFFCAKLEKTKED